MIDQTFQARDTPTAFPAVKRCSANREALFLGESRRDRERLQSAVRFAGFPEDLQDGKALVGFSQHGGRRLFNGESSHPFADDPRGQLRGGATTASGNSGERFGLGRGEFNRDGC